MIRFVLAFILIGIAIGQGISEEENGHEILLNATSVEMPALNLTAEDGHVAAIVAKASDFAIFVFIELVDIGMELGFNNPTYGGQKTLLWIAFFLIVSPLLPTLMLVFAVLAYAVYKAAEFLWKNKTKLVKP